MQPPQCPDEVYALMKRCWVPVPDERIGFGELVTELVSYVTDSDYKPSESPQLSFEELMDGAGASGFAFDTEVNFDQVEALLQATADAESAASKAAADLARFLEEKALKAEKGNGTSP